MSDQSVDVNVEPGHRKWGGFGAAVVRWCFIVLAALSAVVVVVLFFLGIDWVPFGANRLLFGERNVTGMTRFLGLVMAGWILVPAVVVWSVVAMIARTRRHWRTRWVFAAPSIVVLGAAAVIAGTGLSPQSFSDSRNDLDALAREARSHEPGWSQSYTDDPRQVGHLEISRVTYDLDGTVQITDADDDGFEIRGYAHTLNTEPPPAAPGSQLHYVHIDGPWYRYTQPW